MKNEKTSEWIEFKKTPYISKVHYRSLFDDFKSIFKASLLVFIDKEQNVILSREVIH